MNYKKILTLLLIINCQFTFGQWTKINSINGGDARSITTANDSIYIAVGNSVYFSKNNQFDWQDITFNLSNNNLVSISKVLIHKGYLYALGNSEFGQLYKMDVKLKTWTLLPLNKVSDFEFKNDTLYAVENNSLVSGATIILYRYSEVTNSKIPIDSTSSLQQKIPPKFYKIENELFLTWTSIWKIDIDKLKPFTTTGLTQLYFYDLVKIGSSFFVIGIPNSGNRKVMKFNGSIWTNTINNGIPTGELLYRIYNLNSELVGGVINSNYNLHFYLSQDSATTWVKQDNEDCIFYSPNQVFNSLNAVVKLKGGSILLATIDGIYQSFDKGKTLISQNKNITKTAQHLIEHKGILFSYQYNNGQFLESADFGNSWNKIRTDEICTIQGDEYFKLDSAIYFKNTKSDASTISYSINSGKSWEFISKPKGSNALKLIGAINPNVLYFINQDSTGSTGNFTLIKTLDNGKTWEDVPNNLNNQLSNIIGNKNELLCTSNNKYFISIDNGQDWLEAMQGLPIDFRANVSKSFFLNSDFYLKCTYGDFSNYEDSLYKFNSEKLLWELAGEGFLEYNFQKIIVKDLYQYDSILFLVRPYYKNDLYSIYYSKDDGINWTPFSDGIPSNVNINSLVFIDSFIYASTTFMGNNFDLSSEGIYKIKNPFIKNSGNYVATINKLNIKIQPNPAIDNITVTVDEGDYKTYCVEIYNSLGKKVLSEKFNGFSTKINTSNFHTGLYSVIITDSDKKISQKSIIIMNQ